MATNSGHAAYLAGPGCGCGGADKLLPELEQSGEPVDQRPAVCAAAFCVGAGTSLQLGQGVDGRVCAQKAFSGVLLALGHVGHIGERLPGGAKHERREPSAASLDDAVLCHLWISHLVYDVSRSEAGL